MHFYFIFLDNKFSNFLIFFFSLVNMNRFYISKNNGISYKFLWSFSMISRKMEFYRINLCKSKLGIGGPTYMIPSFDNNSSIVPIEYKLSLPCYCDIWDFFTCHYILTLFLMKHFACCLYTLLSLFHLITFCYSTVLWLIIV